MSALGEDKKRKLSGVTFSFKNLLYISVSRYECLVIRFDFDHRKIKDNCYTYLPIQMRFLIGGKRVTCHGSKLTNKLSIPT